MSKTVASFWHRAMQICLLSMLCIAPVSIAADQPGASLRWFDVEVLVFKQDGREHTTPEYFPLEVRPIRLQRHYDLLSAYHQAQFAPMVGMFPECNNSEMQGQWLASLASLKRSAQPGFVQPLMGQQALCRESLESTLLAQWYAPSGGASRSSTQPTIDGSGGDKYTTTEPFLLNAEQHQLTRLRQQLERQSGKQSILHTTWRQPVTTRNQGRKIRLFGGQNFTNDYTYSGFAKEAHQPPYEWQEDWNTLEADNSENPLQRIYTLLDLIDSGRTPFGRPDNQADGLPEPPANQLSGIPQDVWEFDGLMHIYLVGNYLHIDGEFNLREEVQVPLQATSLEAQAEAALRDEDREADFLRAYYFNQLRRVISQETHYFDHPKFGVIVQIRRTELSARR